MPLFSCSVEHCDNAGVRGACCKLCNRHLCSVHLSLTFHRCPDWETEEHVWLAANEQARQQEFTRLLSKLNVDALKTRASALKRGVACSIPQLQYDKAAIREIMGGTNYHIPITFADGETWMCRIRRATITSPASDLQDRVIQSEVATLQFLSNTSVPVPKVHDYGLDTPDNSVGVSYILMDRVKGHSFSWAELRPFEKYKILQQYADIVLELSRHPFPSIGCLSPFTSSSRSNVGPIVLDRHAERDCDGNLVLPGPFTSSAEYRRDIILRHLEQIRTNQTLPKRRLDSYLLHLFLLECVPTISQREDAAGGCFYLKHMDDKGDHVLVDDDMNIMGIIDWEWAQTCPKSEAFSAPLCLVSSVDYLDGENALGPDEIQFAEILDSKGAYEMAGFVRNGRFEHRVAHTVGCNIEHISSFPTAFKAMRSALFEDSSGPQDWQSWKRQALQKYQNDRGLQQILRAESEVNVAEVDLLDSQSISYNFALR